MKKKALKKELRAVQSELQAALALVAAKQIDDRRTLGEWLDVCEKEIRASPFLQPSTVINRVSNIKHCRRLWGSRPIRAVTPHEILSTLRTEFLPLQASSAQRVFGELRAAYTQAISAGWAEVNPARSVKPPSAPVQRKRLTFSVWKRMRKVAMEEFPPWVDAMLLLGLVTGQRRADLRKMRFDDIVTDSDGNEFLRVQQQKERGKRGGPKIEIPLSLRLHSLGLSLGDVIDYCHKIGKPGPTLLRKVGGGALTRSSLSNRFGDCIRRVLGDEAFSAYEWPSLHEVRSLTTRMYRAQGMDVDTVQTLLGHKLREFTQIYEDERDLAVSPWTRVRLNTSKMRITKSASAERTSLGFHNRAAENGTLPGAC